MTILNSADLKQPLEAFNAILSRTNQILAQEYESGPVQSRQVEALIRVVSEVLSTLTKEWTEFAKLVGGDIGDLSVKMVLVEDFIENLQLDSIDEGDE